MFLWSFGPVVKELKSNFQHKETLSFVLDPYRDDLFFLSSLTSTQEGPCSEPKRLDVRFFGAGLDVAHAGPRLGSVLSLARLLYSNRACYFEGFQSQFRYCLMV